MALALGLSFLFSWAAWILFGGYSVANLIIADVCSAGRQAIGPEGNEQLDTLLPCPDEAEARKALNLVQKDVHIGVETVNAMFTGA